MILLVMGVTGSGKTTLAKALATAFEWEFQEGDDLHPPANIAKMKAGIPLSDADRHPWLENVRAWIDGKLSVGVSAVISCSALKRAYRDQLGLGRGGIGLVFIAGRSGMIEDRLARRPRHFMPPALLPSQLALLEPPQADENPILLDAEMTTQAQVAAVQRFLPDPV